MATPVYVVLGKGFGDDEDSFEVIGVTSTEEKAIAYIKESAAEIHDIPIKFITEEYGYFTVVTMDEDGDECTINYRIEPHDME